MLIDMGNRLMQSMTVDVFRLRRILRLSWVWAVALLGCAGVWAQGVETILAPGKLIQGHAKYEEDCKQCHIRFDRKAQDGLCMTCHKEVGADVRGKAGFHGKGKSQSCHTCHTDHKGRDARVAAFDHKQFDHSVSDFALHGKHQKIECEKCHVAGKKFRDAAIDCNGCHRKDDVHKNSLGPKCATCHNESNWKEAKFDHDTARFALTGRHVDTKCADCHKSTNFREAASTCIGCHRKDDDSNKGHKAQFSEKCESCHSTKHWKPSTFGHDTDTNYALRGKHHSTACIDCHAPSAGNIYKDKAKLRQECYACHKKDDKHKETLGTNCASCHSERNWKESPKFNHETTTFPLLGKHAKLECKECHKSLMYKEAPKDCFSCHKKDDKHLGNLGEKCADCHAERNWKTTTGRFNHDKTKFVLHNAHAKTTVKCAACHKDLTSFRKTPLECISCHKKDDKHEDQQGQKCEKCHTDISWKVEKFDHGLTRFPLLAKHAPVACVNCHTGVRFKDAKIACVACHVKEDKHKATLGPDCGQCHNARGWKDWRYDHGITKFPLDGGHKTLACAACHQKPLDKKAPVSMQCISCHGKNDPHEGGFGRQCQQCHVTSSFRSIKQKAGRQVGAVVGSPVVSFGIDLSRIFQIFLRWAS